MAADNIIDGRDLKIIRLKSECFDLQVEFGAVRAKLEAKLRELNQITEDYLDA